MAGNATLGDKLPSDSLRQAALILRRLVDLRLRYPLGPCRRERWPSLGGQQQTDLGILATGCDGYIGEPFTLVFTGDTLDSILAGGQVFRLEAALIAADDHEGETFLIVFQFHKGARDRLSSRVADDARHRTTICRPNPVCRDHQNDRRNSGHKLSLYVSQGH